MKRTTFLKQIKDGPFIYHEDLGGLCSICCEFGYEVFDDLKKLISVHIVDKSNQENILKGGNFLDYQAAQPLNQ
ncbi:16946_t:CDS:2 [Entrophospora sp. SA101]|nr:16946_t:CDS:2 [Entrophospora sp. SA101]